MRALPLAHPRALMSYPVPTIQERDFTAMREAALKLAQQEDPDGTE